MNYQFTWKVLQYWRKKIALLFGFLLCSSLACCYALYQQHLKALFQSLYSLELRPTSPAPTQDDHLNAPTQLSPSVLRSKHLASDKSIKPIFLSCQMTKIKGERFQKTENNVKVGCYRDNLLSMKYDKSSNVA